MVLRRAAAECPKKVSALVDLVNLPTALREFAGGRSQMSHLSFFLRVWSHIKNNNLQDPTNRNIVNCDDKLKTVLLGRSKVELSELPLLVKLHFPKVSKSASTTVPGKVRCPMSGARSVRERYNNAEKRRTDKGNFCN